MRLRFIDHRGFQWEASTLAGSAAAAGAILGVFGAPIGAGQALGLLLGAVSTVLAWRGRERRDSGRVRRLPTLSAGGEVSAGARWRAWRGPLLASALAMVVGGLAAAVLSPAGGPSPDSGLLHGDETSLPESLFAIFVMACLGSTAGALAGLVAAVPWAALHVELSWPDGVTRAWAETAPHLTGEEREPALRALQAHARLDEGLGHARTPDHLRLRREAEMVARQIFALALRYRTQADALAAVDVRAARSRAASLSAAALACEDPTARADLVRAARTLVTRELRVQELSALHERVRARLELHVASLEGTASSVALQQASAVVDAAVAFEPLVGRLREAGDDLHAQAQALHELGLTEPSRTEEPPAESPPARTSANLDGDQLLSEARQSV